MKLTYDGHIHTPFCPHGSTDPFEAYIERAIALGLAGITFTEHAPLPEHFVDPTPHQDCGMARKDLPEYFHTLNRLKSKYANKIQVNIGLEVDYIEGYEADTRALLDEWGEQLDDGILSVHFLTFNEKTFCLDYSPDTFQDMVQEAGSLDTVYRAYFAQVKKALTADLGKYKPRRIGHLTLVNKFQRRFPNEQNYEALMMELLDLIKEKNYMLDYNGAGLTKPLCLEAYPPAWVVGEAVKRQIPLVYGSDAHSVQGMAQGFTYMYLHQQTTSPQLFKESQ